MSVKPVVAGMRLGGRSPDARTGCGMHVRNGVKGVGASEHTPFSVLGTMVDLVQCLSHAHMALFGEGYRWAVGPLCVVVVVAVQNGSRKAQAGWLFPQGSINKHSCRFPKKDLSWLQPIGGATLIPTGVQSSHAKTAFTSIQMTSRESSPTFSSST